jgi:hypothetical protein
MISPYVILIFGLTRLNQVEQAGVVDGPFGHSLAGVVGNLEFAIEPNAKHLKECNL